MLHCNIGVNIHVFKGCVNKNIAAQHFVAMQPDALPKTLILAEFQSTGGGRRLGRIPAYRANGPASLLDRKFVSRLHRVLYELPIQNGD